jgi:putative SOS response-associated peptidase YedK
VCGRYKQTTKAAELAALFGAVVDAAFVEEQDRLDRPRFNAAPTQRLPIVRVGDGRRLLRPARWGLLPAWARDEKTGSNLLNARSETAFEKPAFRDSLQKRRCLVPVDGFYEWKTDGKSKQPYLFSFANDRPFTLAGLWSTWNGPAGVVESFAILTTTANELLRPLHDRMPVILEEKQYDEWLDPARHAVALDAWCAPREWPGLSLRPVSRRLGNVRHDDAALLVPDNQGSDDDDNAPAGTAPRPRAKKARATGQQRSLF